MFKIAVGVLLISFGVAFFMFMGYVPITERLGHASDRWVALGALTVYVSLAVGWAKMYTHQEHFPLLYIILTSFIPGALFLFGWKYIASGRGLEVPLSFASGKERTPWM